MWFYAFFTATSTCAERYTYSSEHKCRNTREAELSDRPRIYEPKSSTFNCDPTREQTHKIVWNPTLYCLVHVLKPSMHNCTNLTYTNTMNISARNFIRGARDKCMHYPNGYTISLCIPLRHSNEPTRRRKTFGPECVPWFFIAIWIQCETCKADKQKTYNKRKKSGKESLFACIFASRPP